VTVEDLATPLPIFADPLVLGTPVAPGADTDCLVLLAAEGVGFGSVAGPPGVGTPVQLDGDAVLGVQLRYYYPGRMPRVMDCRLALGLARAAPVLRANGVAEIIFSNHWRPSFTPLRAGQYNVHHQGLAIDVQGFRLTSGKELWIERDYEPGLGFAVPDSCLGRPLTPRGLLLRKLACDLDEADVFESILTPDYDDAHWNHFHWSAFHAEQRTRVRPRGTALLEVPMSELTLWAMRRPIYQEPAERRWDAVAARPWPVELTAARERLGLPDPSLPTDADLAAALQPGPGLLDQAKRVWESLEPDLVMLLGTIFPGEGPMGSGSPTVDSRLEPGAH
jgi:hypothetical protein